MISFSPSEDQQMMINLVKQFAADEMRKIYRQCDEKGQIPAEIIDTAWEMGFISSCIPSEQGGLGEQGFAESTKHEIRSTKQIRMTEIIKKNE